MRAAFGVVSLLIVIGVIVWFMGAPGGHLDQTQQALEARERVTPQVQAMGGRDAQGRRLSETIELELQHSGGQIDSILVLRVEEDSAAVERWGLRRSDSIIAIGPMPVRGNLMITSNTDAAIMLEDAFARNLGLTVVRQGREIQLPQAPVLPTAQTSPDASTPSPASDQPVQRRESPLHRQLDAIQGLPGR